MRGIKLSGWMAVAAVMLLNAGVMMAEAGTKVTKVEWGKTENGSAVELFTLKSGAVEATLTTYGARIVSVKTADRNGKVADVVLGFSSVKDWLNAHSTYMGAVVGRYGNRIAKGKFSLDGKNYQVPVNNSGNALHGGPVGFDQKIWAAKEVPDGVEFMLTSPDGDMGFPGTLMATVKYTLIGHSLRIDYTAKSDKDTVVNLTNHSYFNLHGDDVGTILDLKLQLFADRYTPVDATLIPTGELAPVAGTPLDFRKSTVIGARIGDANEQLKLAGGYDHNFVVDGKMGELREAAKVVDPVSGRTLEVSTTQPGVQFYTGNFLDGTYTGRAGVKYTIHKGFCLETQHYPDSPNHAAFPTTELKPGEVMHTTTVFKFGVE